MVEGNIEGQLKGLATNELIELQKAITKILDEREVSEDVIKSAIDYLTKIGMSTPRYTQLTLYLEKQGLRREAIARRMVDMWKKNTSIAEGGCPIGEQESSENPIYPYVEGIRYYQICYLHRR